MKEGKSIIIIMLVVLFLSLSTNIFLHHLERVNWFILTDEVKELRWYYYDLVTLVSTGLLFLIGFIIVRSTHSFLIRKIMLTGILLSVIRITTYVLFGLIYDHYFIAVFFVDIITYSIYTEIKKATD